MSCRRTTSLAQTHKRGKPAGSAPRSSETSARCARRLLEHDEIVARQGLDRGGDRRLRRPGLPLQLKHPKYGARKHGLEGIGKAGSRRPPPPPRSTWTSRGARRGRPPRPLGQPVDPDKATKAQEHNFLRRQAGDDVHRQFGLSRMPTGSELTALLRVHKPYQPDWDVPVRDSALQIIPFADLGGTVRDHRHFDRGQLRTCPTSNAVNAGPLHAIDFLVRCGATADDVADFATSMQGWLGRAGGAKPGYETFLGAPEKPAPAHGGGTLRSAPVPKERELPVCASKPMPDGWRLPEIAVVVVDVLASSRDVGTAGICEIAFDVLGAGDQHVSFSSVSIPRGASTYEAYLGHGFTKTMLMKAGAPELGEVLKERRPFSTGSSASGGTSSARTTRATSSRRSWGTR